MKAVLMSIQPKWCELIANGKKTVEVRKTRPKLETPFKVYIYCTKGDALAFPCLNNPKFEIHRMNNGTLKGKQMTVKEQDESDHIFANGKVIGEFVCDEIYKYTASPVISEHIKSQCTISDEDMIRQSCMALKDLYHYESYPESHNWGLLGWHISNLVIYDKPKELSEFNAICPYKNTGGTRKNVSCPCDKYSWGFDEKTGMSYCNRRITRPPQSWCYVEELRRGLMKVYIAGGISNNPNYEQQFAEAEKELLAQGHAVLNPVKNLGFDYRDYINMGLCELMHCDAIYLLDGYEASSGALLELHYAKTVGMRIFKETE